MNMINFKNYAVNLMVFIFCVTTMATTTPVQAGHAGAFLGGIAVAKIGRSIRDNNDYQEDQAYYAQQQAEAAQSQARAANPPKKTTEQRMADLDKLAKGGYITPEEYKAKKKQILDDI
jgi:membrane protease subunit (stomatin/prohibitin family)